MLGVEMRVRLEAFRDIDINDWDFQPKHRTKNFEDVLDPNNYHEKIYTNE